MAEKGSKVQVSEGGGEVRGNKKRKRTKSKLESEKASVPEVVKTEANVPVSEGGEKVQGKKKKKTTKSKIEVEHVAAPEVVKAEPKITLPEGNGEVRLNRKATKILKRKAYEEQRRLGLTEQNSSVPTNVSNPKNESTGKSEKKPKDRKRKKNFRNTDVEHYRELDRKYKDILDKLVRVDIESDAVPLIKDEAETGRIEKSEIEVVIQRYKAMRRRMADAAHLRKLILFEGSLEELKGMVTQLVKKQKLRRDQAGDIVTKWKAREGRRTDRRDVKKNNVICLLCRMKGHKIADCPDKDTAEDRDSDHCFKCNAMDHNIYSCPKKYIKGFPFAVCFICKGDGHLSRDCEQNKTGIYPDGGSCDLCNSQKHLKRDCPELKYKEDDPKQKRVIKARSMNAMTNMDEEEVDDDEEKPTTGKPAPKTVTF